MKTVAFLLSALVGSGIYAKDFASSPLVSGRVILIHNHEQPVETLLTPDQLKVLDQWWKQQMPDWTRKLCECVIGTRDSRTKTETRR